MSSSSPLDYAKQGDVEYFKTVELNVLQNFKGENGDGILALTAKEGILDCCEVIYQRCPEQLFCQNRHGNSVLHLVAHHRGEMLSLLKFFLDVGAKAKGDIESGVKEDNIQFKEWCKLQNQDGETALLRTIKVSNLEAARLWLEVDNDHKLQLLSVANNEGNTPLHLAVENEDLEVVKLLIRDNLDFEYGANRNGKTPVMLAIKIDQSRLGNSRDYFSVKIRELILESQPDQIKVRTGNKDWTLLHYAAYKGNLGAVKDMIRFCPDCMDMVDMEGQNFLHTAVKFGRTDLVRDILGAKQMNAKILNEQDNDGHTPLHIAALSDNEPMARCLLYDVRVKKTTTNSNNQRVLDAINFEFDKRKAGISIKDKLDEKDLSFQINLGLVTATLIATVTFTAGITLPGGYISQGTNLGMATLSKSVSFEVFVISNNFALLLSIYAVFNNLCANYLLERDDIIHRLQTATLCSLLALLLMVVAFMTGSYAVLAISNGIAIAILVISSSFVVFMFPAVYRDIIKNMKYRVYDA